MARHKEPPKRRLRTVPSSIKSAREEDQQLLSAIRRALRSDDPLDLLMHVSTLLTVTDPRSRDPFARAEPYITLDKLVESFIGTPYAETTAALTVIQALSDDEVMRARIGRELAKRRHPMPGWLRSLDAVKVDPTVGFLTEMLGDGDDYFVSASLPDGESLTSVIYVDHNMGTVVKDGFVLPATRMDIIDRLQVTVSEDQTLTVVDPASARAFVEDAIARGARTYPPLESDTWPACRPLVEWMLRLLPSGGVLAEPKEWSDEEKAEIETDFFDSEFGRGIDSPDARRLLDSVLWFGTAWGPCDPYRWSPVNVEILLADWFPRKVIAPVALLSKLPKVLRAYISYCHDKRGIRTQLTVETIDSLEHWTPEYLRLIRSDRPQGVEALLETMLDANHEHGIAEIVLRDLDDAVGGRLKLANLDDAPLPDEPFEWADVAEDIRPVVAQVLALCDRCADELLDVEHRTAMRRFLGRAAVGDPAIFRRRASVERAAAAVAWVICRANDSGPDVQDLLGWFGVRGSVSQRAEPLLRANGVDMHRRYGRMALGTPSLLTADMRAKIIESRDLYLAAE